MTNLKDKSIFAGIIEINDTQFHKQGGGVWHVYVLNGKNWVFDDSIQIKGRCTKQKLVDTYEQLLDSRFMQQLL